MSSRNISVVFGLCLLIIPLAGCVEEELREPTMELIVERAEVWGSECHELSSWQMDSGDDCHQIDVRLNNHNEAEDVDTSLFNWDVTDDQGGVRDVAEVLGPDAVAPGGRADVTLLFSVPEGVVLQDVRFEAIWMSDPVKASIPAYTEEAQAGNQEGTESSEPDDNGTGEAQEDTEGATSSRDDQGDFRDGTHRVGEDIESGRYRAIPSGNCYWERLDGFSGDFEDIKANGNHDGYPVIVDVLAEDEGFRSEGCGWWTSTLDPLTDPMDDRGDGFYRVGEEMAPGTWQASAGDTCYWERLGGFTGELEDINANGNPRDTVIVEVQEGDVGFHTSGCGTWILLE